MPDAARVRLIEVSGFRAFPGGHPSRFELGSGCNLLLFGENGSGKSSLYRALRELFSTEASDIGAYRNVFSDEPSRVGVTLTDGTVLDWVAAGHPTAAVTDIARRSAFLTHTALRELIYNNAGPDTPKNVFGIALSSIIGDFEATLDGGVRRSIRELWDTVTTAYAAREVVATGTRRPRNYVPSLDAACQRFSEGMRQALDALEGAARPLLARLLDVLRVDALELAGLLFSPVVFRDSKKPSERILDNKSLVVQVRVRGHKPAAAQSFLNEGRQTALALAIYLAGRLVCAPPGKDKLKLLVMDDLLISLDASHRRPVLDLILQEFADWQVILLTHDRYWFQLAREQVRVGGWKTVELYESYEADGLLCPLVRPVVEDMVEATLQQAERFLADHHLAAACNYARSACELMLRRFCITQSVRLVLTDEGQPKPNLQKLLDAAMNKASKNATRHAALKALLRYKKFVLNPLSHNPGVPVPSADVQRAIGAVRACVVALREYEV